VRRSVPQIFPHIILLVLVLLISAAAQAQGRNGNQPDLQQREWALGHIPDEVNSHFTPRNKSAPPDTRADFRRLQIVNNDLMKRFFVLHTADARAIKSALDEIHKLADRLQTNLAFPAPASAPAPAAEKPLFRPGLLQLDHAVMSFVNNRVFQETKLVDASLAERAGKDLNEIVRLSELLARLNLKEAAGK
jgi:hypothetical protein